MPRAILRARRSSKSGVLWAVLVMGWSPLSAGLIGGVEAGDVKAFDFEIFLDSQRAALTAYAGLLNPAEGGNFHGDTPCIEANHAELQLFCDPPGPVDIPGIEVGGESVRGRIGYMNSLAFRVEAKERS